MNNLRKCGNCRKEGHSSRTCPMMKEVSNKRAQAVSKAAKDKLVSREV